MVLLNILKKLRLLYVIKPFKPGLDVNVEILVMMTIEMEIKKLVCVIWFSFVEEKQNLIFAINNIHMYIVIN